MTSSMRYLWCAALTLCAAPSLQAAPVPEDAARQSAIDRALTLIPDELEKLVRGERVVPTWREKGSQFWFAADRADGVDYLRVDPDRKSISPLFDRAKLEAALRKVSDKDPKFEGLSYDFDKDEVSFDHAGQRWKWSSRDEQLTPSEKKTGLSPDKHWQVRVQDFNLYLEDRTTGKSRQLTTDGSSEHAYARPIASLRQMTKQGTSVPTLDPDVVWSPDSTRFVTYRMNLDGARHLSAVQSTPPGGGPPRVYDYVYPLTGDEHVPVAQTLIVNAASGATITVGSPTYESLYWGGPEFEWTADSKAIFQRIVTRGYGSMQLYSIDASTGRSSVLASETSNRFVDWYAHRWYYLEGVDAVAWMGEVQGWNEAFLIDRSGKRHQLTTGQWTVADVPAAEKSGHHLFVVGRGREAGRDPYVRSLYSVDREGRSTKLLTPEALDHDVSVSPDGRFFVDNQSLIDRPTTTTLRSTRSGAVVMKLQDADISELTKRKLILPEPFTATAADGETALYGAIYKPSTFDPNKRYPIVEFIYAGPHAITTPKSFTEGLRVDAAFAVAELGFVVIVVDGHGTSGRGRAFLDPAWHNLHAVGLDDHVAAIKAVSAKRSYMDVTNVGIYGYSAGAYDVFRAMTERPDFYKVGVAASGNHDNRLDKAVWNEQWMGFPLGPHYDANSNITWASKLQGKLFLVHGELDENVPLAATLRLVDALSAANKPFELLIVPNADHWLAPVPYYNRRRFEFLMRNLAPPTP